MQYISALLSLLATFDQDHVGCAADVVMPKVLGF